MISFCIAIVYTIITQQYDAIPLIGSFSTISLLGTTYLLPYITSLETFSDKELFQQQKEMAVYLFISTILYRIFQPNYSAVIVSWLASITVCIGVRQTYLTKKKEIKQEKKS